MLFSLHARAPLGEAFSGEGTGRGTDIVGKDGRIVKDAFNGDRKGLKGRMSALDEALIPGIERCRGSAHPGTNKGGMLSRMVGGMLMLLSMSPCLDHHKA